jgi:hypothetical protein
MHVLDTLTVAQQQILKLLVCSMPKKGNNMIHREVCLTKQFVSHLLLPKANFDPEIFIINVSYPVMSHLLLFLYSHKEVIYPSIHIVI